MEAKDTVIKNEDMMELVIPCETCDRKPCWGFPTRECMECITLKHREAQAEITFKAGQEDKQLQYRAQITHLGSVHREITQKLVKEARKEVVDWVKETNHEPISSGVVSPEWQAKLKEWNVGA